MSSYKVIADSGSTKTDWVVVDGHANTVKKIKTIGFNPYFHSSEFIFQEVSKAFSVLQISMEDVQEVHYYGSGCSSDEMSKVVSDALVQQFPKADVQVNHDLIAAARSTLGNAEGIACIVGTGSNSCVWKEGKVEKNIPSHGYIFGDEGSGSYLGIALVRLYLEDKLNDELKAAFEKQFKMSKDELLNATYRKSNANVFLAHFASFYLPNLHHQELRDIVFKGLDDFFKVRVLPYEEHNNLELGFVGSIAFYYQDVLKEVAANYGATIKKIAQCPIDDLLIFHGAPAMMKAV